MNCGRSIEGPSVGTPGGDIYHYECVDINYPEPCKTDDALDDLEERDVDDELVRLFRFIRQDPYLTIDSEEFKESLPEVNVRIRSPITVNVNILGYQNSWDIYNRTEKVDIAPWIFQSVYFGCALEREFPAFADRDHINPRGESRVGDEEGSED